MFLRIVPIRRPSKKKVHYVRLVESYYNRGKIKQQTIANLRRRKLLAPHVDQLVELLKGEPRKTMTEEKHLSAVEAVCAYKEFSQVEQAFRKLRDVLEMRPIYHHDPQRVQVHVFVAALAFLLDRLLEKKLKLAKLPFSTEEALTLLRTVHVVEADVGGTKHRGVTAGNRQARQILSALKISFLEPWKPKKRTSKTPT